MKSKKTLPKRVILVGLGPIGLETCQALLKNTSFKLVGVMDRDPQKKGTKIGNLRIDGNLRECVRKHKPKIAFLTTTSKFPSVIEDIKTLVSMGVDVVSSCEELSYPWRTHAKLADQVDAYVRKNKGRVVGTGVNPGFLMDVLPLFLTTVCQKVDAIRVRRIVDVAKRRQPLQQKMAVGLSPEAFHQKMEKERMGHVGLAESLAMIADGMGWKVITEETIGPVLAARPMKTQHFSIPQGHVIGITQVLRGIAGGREMITLELAMSVDAEDPRDEVEIDGVPPIRMKICGGTHGDRATSACMLNAALKLDSAPYGIITVRDLKAATCGRDL